MKLPKFLHFSKKKLLLLPVAAALLYLLLVPKLKAPPKIEVATVLKEGISEIVSSSGLLSGKRTASLKFKSAGKLSYINVSAGDRVKAYQAVAGVDSRDLSIALQQAENTYRDKQAIAEKIEDDVKDHGKDETFTQKMNRTTAQAARDSAYDSVKAARRALEDTQVTAPFSGIVTEAIASSNQTVTSSDVIAKIVDDSEIYFEADIDEADLPGLKASQKATVTLDAYPDKTFSGQLDQILPLTKTTSQGATVVTVKIKLEDFKENFISGLTGQVEIVKNHSDNALTIPLEALLPDNWVVLAKEKDYKKVKVETGIQSDSKVEVLKGLSENDQVVTNPSDIPNVASDNSIRIQRRGNVFSPVMRIFGGGRSRE